MAAAERLNCRLAFRARHNVHTRKGSQTIRRHSPPSGRRTRVRPKVTSASGRPHPVPRLPPRTLGENGRRTFSLVHGYQGATEHLGCRSRGEAVWPGAVGIQTSTVARLSARGGRHPPTRRPHLTGCLPAPSLLAYRSRS